MLPDGQLSRLRPAQTLDIERVRIGDVDHLVNPGRLVLDRHLLQVVRRMAEYLRHCLEFQRRVRVVLVPAPNLIPYMMFSIVFSLNTLG